MGQYHYVVNLDKREYLHPHRLGDGLKLMEFGSSAGGTMTALAILLAVSNGRGGGDLGYPADGPLSHRIGSWGGDRIVVIGDYGEARDLPEADHAETLYQRCVAGDFTDISADLMALIEWDRNPQLEPVEPVENGQSLDDWNAWRTANIPGGE